MLAAVGEASATSAEAMVAVAVAGEAVQTILSTQMGVQRRTSMRPHARRARPKMCPGQFPAPTAA